MPDDLKAIKARVLMKSGVWLVPPSERPPGWEKYGLQEPKPATPPVTTPLLDAIVEAHETPVQTPAKDWRETIRELRKPIQKGAEEFGDIALAFPAMVMLCGIWSRSRATIAEVLESSLATVAPVAARFEDSGIWSKDGAVVLGDPDDDETGNGIEFYLNAMVGLAMINGRMTESGMVYWAIGVKAA